MNLIMTHFSDVIYRCLVADSTLINWRKKKSLFSLVNQNVQIGKIINETIE
jgi:hypothetical protein